VALPISDFERLIGALVALPKREPVFVPQITPVEAVYVMDTREAMLCAYERAPLESAAGRVVAEAVGTYPPGVPWVVPGERLTAEAIEAMREAQALGAELFGLEQGYVRVVV
jgi:arginine/lysine/ornithine decarboxylase